MEISEAEFVSLWVGTQHGFESIWYIVEILSPLSSFLPRTAVTSDLNYVSYFSVFLKEPLWLSFAVFSWKDLFLVTCGTFGNTVSCTSPPDLEKATGVVGLYPFLKHSFLNIKSGGKSGYSFTAKSIVPFVMEINKR